MYARTTPLHLRTFDIARRSSAHVSIHLTYLYPKRNDVYPEWNEYETLYPTRGSISIGLIVHLVAQSSIVYEIASKRHWLATKIRFDELLIIVPLLD